MKSITVNKLHSLIRSKIGLAKSKYSVAQRINRKSYDLYNRNNIVGIFSTQYLADIIDMLKIENIPFDETTVEKGFVKLKIVKVVGNTFFYEDDQISIV